MQRFDARCGLRAYGKTCSRERGAPGLLRPRSALPKNSTSLSPMASHAGTQQILSWDARAG
jgi:hypothetical protein